MNEPVITIVDEDEALADELRERIYEFNADATGIDDGRLMFASIRDERDALIAGAAGWTWAGCGYVDQLWVRADHRGQGLGTSLLDAFESEARARGCELMIVATHSFQAPRLYERRGYEERGRVEGYPRGHAHIQMVKRL